MAHDGTNNYIARTIPISNVLCSVAKLLGARLATLLLQSGDWPDVPNGQVLDLYKVIRAEVQTLVVEMADAAAVEVDGRFDNGGLEHRTEQERLSRGRIACRHLHRRLWK